LLKHCLKWPYGLGFALFFLFISIPVHSSASTPEPAERLLRLQPFRPFPENLVFLPKTVEELPDGNVFLNAQFSGVDGDSVQYDELQLPCERECTVSLPLTKKTQVHTLTANGQTTEILFHWMDIPSWLKRQQVKLGQGSNVRITDDKSGFDPSTYSLLVTADNKLGSRVTSEKVKDMELRPFSYAATETEEWRLIITQGDNAFANFDGRGELPQTIPLATALGEKKAEPGQYQVRMDIVYAGKFHAGQPVSFEVVDTNELGWNLGVAAVAAQVYFARNSFYLSPVVQWLPQYSVTNQWIISGALSLSTLKDAATGDRLLFSQLSARLERVIERFRAGGGVGASWWPGSSLSVCPTFDATAGYQYDPFGWQSIKSSIVLEYNLSLFPTLLHIVRMGIRFEL
jgi:hypothetical protein